MTVETYRAQTMLVAIGAIGGIILATASDAIKQEVKDVSSHLNEHILTAPTEPGLYVWEGDITSSGINQLATWTGSFRNADQVDLFAYGMLPAPMDAQAPKAPVMLSPGVTFDTWWTMKAIQFKGRPFMSRREAAMEAWTAAQEVLSRSQAVAAKEETGRAAKRPDAVSTADLPELRLQCYHASVHAGRGNWPDDRFEGWCHNSIELVDPAPGTHQLLQAWENEDCEATDELALRNVIIEDRHGERRFLSWRWGKSMLNHNGSITFHAYTERNLALEQLLAKLDRDQAA